MDSDEAGVRFTCNIIGVINAPGNLEKQDLTFRVSLQNKGETCKLRVVSLDNGNKYYEEVKYWIESNKNSPTEFLLSKLSEDHAQFTILFDNKRSPLDKIIKMILHFKKTDFFKIHLPIKKDFNEDLESLC